MLRNARQNLTCFVAEVYLQAEQLVGILYWLCERDFAHPQIHVHEVAKLNGVFGGCVALFFGRRFGVVGTKFVALCVHTGVV